MLAYAIWIAVGGVMVVIYCILFKKYYLNADYSCPECGHDESVSEIVAMSDMWYMTKYTCKKCGHSWDMTF